MISLARNQWLSCVLRICLEPPVSSPKLCGRLFLCLTGRLHWCQCLFSGYELHRITLLLAKSDRIAESEFECNQRMEQRILVFRHEKFGMMLCCQLQILGHAQIVFGYLVVTLNCVCKFGWQRKWVAMISLARNQWLSCVLRICLEPPVSSPKLCGRLFLCLTGRLHCCQCLFSGDELHRITLLLAKSDSNQRMEQRILVFRHEKFGMMLCCQLQILGHAQIVSGYICLWPLHSVCQSVAFPI